MSLDISVSTNGIRTSLSQAAIVDVARGALRSEKVRNALLSITLLDRRGIARLNKRHIGHTGPTDVISFGFARSRDTDPVIGDIYICADVAKANASANGVTQREEMTRLVVHGVLHVLGHDHPDSDDRMRSEMWARQERIVRRFASRKSR